MNWEDLHETRKFAFFSGSTLEKQKVHAPRKGDVPKSLGEKYLGDSQGKSTRDYELLESKWESTIGVRYSWNIGRHGATSAG